MDTEAKKQWNKNNPAVRRILQELKELHRDDNPDILVEANEENIFELHFAIRGAWDTEFEGGIYHGRIIMPAEYPFKPPAFVMLTPSGRFETNVKICLSISSHHPESWQPSWSVRSALVALIAFMQSPGHGALGSLDQPKDARQQMAAASREKPPVYGNEARQKVIHDMHQRMLDMEPRSRQQYQPAPPATPTVEAQQLAQSAQQPAQEHGQAAWEGGVLPAEPALLHRTDAPAPAPEEGLRQRRAAEAVPGQAPIAAAPAQPQPAVGQQWAPAPAGTGPQLAPQTSFEDRLLTWLALLLVAGILALLARRVFGGMLLGGEVGRAGHALSDSQL